MNKTIMDGNLTKQPELRFTTNNKAVCTFDIANNEGWGDNKQTNYFKIVVWGKVAENCANHLDKGSKVLICGRLGNRSYEDKEGVKRYVTEITASEVQFLGNKGTGNNNSDYSAPIRDAFDGVEYNEDITPVDDDSSMPF